MQVLPSADDFFDFRVDLSFTGSCAEVICISELPGIVFLIFEKIS